MVGCWALVQTTAKQTKMTDIAYRQASVVKREYFGVDIKRGVQYF